MMMFQPVGGMDRIPYAFEAGHRQGQDRVRRQGRCRLNNTADRRLGGLHRPRRPDQEPRSRLRGQHDCRPTSPPRFPATCPPTSLDALEFATPSDAGKIGIEYSRRWWEEDHRIYGGITNTNIDLGNMWYPSTVSTASAAPWSGYYNTGASARVYSPCHPESASAAPLTRARRSTATCTARTSRRRSRLTGAAPNSPKAHGWAGPSQTDAKYAKLLEPTGNIYFAGDHLSHAIAWQHGAMTSARAAVTALHTRVAAAVAG